MQRGWGMTPKIEAAVVGKPSLGVHAVVQWLSALHHVRAHPWWLQSRDVVRASSKVCPDIAVFVDLEPTPSAIRQVERLSFTQIPIIALTAMPETAARRQPSRLSSPSRVVRFTLREESASQLLKLLQTCHALSFELRAKRTAEQPQAEQLSTTENQVLALVAQGKSNRMIAADLSVGEKTVERSLTLIYAKLGLKADVRNENPRVVAALRYLGLASLCLPPGGGIKARRD
jgi:DNA-binding NarL/FixJ family response regulator